jgi:hypothetical protein
MIVISVTRLVIHNNANKGIAFNCNGQARSLIISPYVSLNRDVLFEIKLNKNSTGDIYLNGVVSLGEKKYVLSQKISFNYKIGEDNVIFISVLDEQKNNMDNTPKEALPYFMNDFFTLKKMSELNYLIYEKNGTPFLACKGNS